MRSQYTVTQMQFMTSSMILLAIFFPTLFFSGFYWMTDKNPSTLPKFNLMKSTYLVFSSSLTIPTSHTWPGIAWSQCINKECIAQKQTIQLVWACATQSTMPIQIVVQLNAWPGAHPTLNTRESFMWKKFP